MGVSTILASLGMMVGTTCLSHSEPNNLNWDLVPWGLVCSPKCQPPISKPGAEAQGSAASPCVPFVNVPLVGLTRFGYKNRQWGAEYTDT